MLNLNDLYYFVQVVSHNGFAAASRHLGIPKSTLSKRVAELEKALGVRLIHRTSRSFTLNEVGREFHRHAAAMMIEAEAAEGVVRGRLSEPSGTVRITASIPTTQRLLAEALPQLALTYPRLRVVVEASDRFVDIVQEGFDLALRDHFRPLPDTGLVQRRVYFDPGYLVAAQAYVARRGTPSTPDELADHDGLLASATSSTWSLNHQQQRAVDVTPLRRFTANESTVLLAAAVAGLGITSLPRGLCQASLAAGALRRVLPDWTTGGVTTTLLMPHRRGQLPSVRAVADFLVERAA